MTILINDQEIGSSVRSKLNKLFDSDKFLGTLGAGGDLSQFPFSNTNHWLEVIETTTIDGLAVEKGQFLRCSIDASPLGNPAAWELFTYKFTSIDKQKSDVWTIDHETMVISTSYSVQSGLNSFKLGEMHTDHSGSENKFTQNNVSMINWFPVWQGVKPLAGVGVPITINPTSRQYTTPKELFTNGLTPTGEDVPYSIEVTLVENESILKLEVAAGENYSGTITYEIRNVTPSGLLKFTQTEDISVVNGDPISMLFTHPSESRTGDVIYVILKKENGDILLTKSGTDNSIPWLKLTLMNFEDIEVSSGVRFITSSIDVRYSSQYAVDTTESAVTLTVDRSTGLNSFHVFDASKNLAINNCEVVFGGGQGTFLMNKRNDSYLFYYDGTIWRYLDMNTKDGGVV